MILTRPSLRLAPAVLGLCLLTSACGQEPAAPDGVGDTVEPSAEVLEGSISDAMLPLDSTRSSAPIDVPVPEKSDKSSDQDSSSSALPAAEAVDDAAASASEPSPAPADSEEG